MAVAPGEAIGILGGGQLARMLALAAARLGIRTLILAPEEIAPATQVCTRHIRADYTDARAITEFVSLCAVVTHEWENVPIAAVNAIAKQIPVLPSPRALEAKQDRLTEKQFLTGIGVSVAPFADVSNASDLTKAGGVTGFPAVLKTRRLGYDGKGQSKVSSQAELAKAWEDHARVPCVLEGFIKFDGEASIIAARGVDGSFAAYDLTENTHTREHILKTSRVPARWNGALAAQAQATARKIAEALDYVGVLGVEFFVTGGKLLVNEIAPRVHNSGHWTIDAAVTSQFEQHVRAICGWPLGSTARHSDAVMTNLIGDEVKGWTKYAADPDMHIHLYGKREARAGRKMGHVTRTAPLTK